MRISRNNFHPADHAEGHDVARQENHYPSPEEVPYEEWYTVDGGISRRPLTEEAENPVVRQVFEQQMQASRELSPAPPGSWESHFFLAPNVRFTRTPDRHVPDRQQQMIEARAALAAVLGEEEGLTAVEAEVEALIQNAPVETLAEPVADQTVVAETAVAAPVEAVAEVPVEATSPAPFPVAFPLAPTPEAAAWKSYREQFDSSIALTMGRLTMDAVVRTMPPEPADEAEAREPVLIDLLPLVAPLPPMAHLSDFAFWETISLDLDLANDNVPAMVEAVAAAAPASTPTAPLAVMRAEVVRFTPPAPLPEPVPQVDTVASLYRIHEWTRAAHVPAEIAAPAVVVGTPETVAAVEPEVPVVAEAAPVVEPAPVVIEQPAQAAEPVVAVEITPVPVAAREPFALSRARPFEVDERPNAALFDSDYEFPPRTLLQQPPASAGYVLAQEVLEQNAGLLESVLEDFGVRGEIIHVRPGPVVTLYEFEPAPGVKSSRVIGLADDIARSMSALSARVAVVPGRNVIGIELPNATRETVYFREMIDSQDFARTSFKLPLCLGKTIGGEPVIAELAKMPHLLVAGTTGSGKSVAINTMILSLLYRFRPEECRLIMVDPKMLELSIYDGIPHLLTPVVTDPKKAVMALKWAVREMEERYKKMSRLGVRNIDGYNARAASARERGEVVNVTVQTGFDKNTGELLHETQEMELDAMPYIVVIVDEMADLMMVAGKEIEGAIQRLAQMARAAGIHLIMATQRPSVDVITGTIKANFPTRISFQVTSKIDSRTILGEQGAEQLLGQGDMLHMAGGGRIMRVHGPFVSDEEVEKVVLHLKAQGRPEYLDTVTADETEEEEPEEAPAVFDKTDMASEDGNDLYDKAIKIVFRDKKCSTSYIQRRLAIGYNRAASLGERMEKEGLVGPANHVGKRELLSQTGSAPAAEAE